MTEQKGKDELGLFEERLGPLRFRFSARAGARGFRWTEEGWSLAGLPLPRWMAPRVRAYSFARDGLYRFSVVVAHPWIGVIAAYAGRCEIVGGSRRALASAPHHDKQFCSPLSSSS